MEEQDLEKVKELGYRIRSIDDEKGDLVVTVETPFPNMERKVFRFDKSSEMMETKKYVQDGEIYEDPRWKLKIDEIIEKELEKFSENDTQELDNDFSDYEGKKVGV